MSNLFHPIEQFKQQYPDAYEKSVSLGCELRMIGGEIWVIGDDIELTAPLFIAITKSLERGKESERLANI